MSEKIVKASEVYVQHAWLRAAVNLIPYIGSSLDVVLASRGIVHQKRILELLKNLEEEMSLIKEERIDIAYLESEEFSDILLRVMEASLKARDRDKIRLYAKFLRGVVLFQDRHRISSEDYLAALIELTPSELEVARAIYKQQYDSEPNSDESDLQWAWRKGWNDLPNQVMSVLKEELPFILLRVQKSGLIRELSGSYVGYEGEVYVITDAFRKLVHFIGDDEFQRPRKYG